MKITFEGSVAELTAVLALEPGFLNTDTVLLAGEPEAFSALEPRPLEPVVSERALQGFRKQPDSPDGVSSGDNAKLFADFANDYLTGEPQNRAAYVTAAFKTGGIVAHMLAAGTIYEAFAAMGLSDTGYPKFATLPENPDPTLRQVCASIITLASFEGLLVGHAAPLKYNERKEEEPK